MRATSGVIAPRLPVAPTHLRVAVGALVASMPAAVIAVRWPIAAVGAIAMIAFVWLALAHQLRTRLLWTALVLLLLGYALLGRGFAHIGTPPVYIGEIVLFLAAATILGYAGRFRASRVSILLLLFAGVGALRTLPYLGEYKTDALRDAVVWGYSGIALAIALTLRGEHFPRVVAVYEQLLPTIVIGLPLVGAIYLFYWEILPSWPGAPVPLGSFKGGDAGIHLGGAAAFLLASATRKPGARGDRFGVALVPLWIFWMAGAGIVASLSRGGLLALALGVGVAVTLTRSSRVPTLILAASLSVGMTALFAPALDPAHHRAISLEQVAANVVSIVVPSSDPTLDGTIRWREEWWGEIVDYTVRGPYFWTGKGFGVNLADDDGFQVTSDGALRSPHNGHLTILARMGVPGFVLWVALQAGFGVAMWRALRRARRIRDAFWFRIDLWLLCYWVAMIVNMMFDVYLEGPQGGIWFWSVFGLGLAALQAQREAPIYHATHPPRP